VSFNFFHFSELTGTEWITKDQLQLILVEQIADLEYDNFVNAMHRLATQPYSYKAKEFIDKYRKPLMSQTNTYNIPQLQYDPDGRGFITVYGEF
jgi:small subunit ribosomal protein S9